MDESSAAALLVAAGPAPLLLVADHASAAVPPGVELGIPAELFADHIAIDIGAGALARALAVELGAAAWLGAWSRLVCDVNRPPDSPDIIPEMSDGIPVPGNCGLSPAARAGRLSIHGAFHAGLAARVDAQRPKLLVSVHSFTPGLRTCAEPRPWPVAILWNRDARAARLGLAALAQETGLGGPVGANQPYSGQVLNYTMDRHAEANGIPYLGFEVRQDQIGDDNGVRRWAAILGRCIGTVAEALP